MKRRKHSRTFEARVSERFKMLSERLTNLEREFGYVQALVVQTPGTYKEPSASGRCEVLDLAEIEPKGE